jgi:hypothetical protein
MSASRTSSHAVGIIALLLGNRRAPFETPPAAAPQSV